jgi:hypothetical protein
MFAILMCVSIVIASFAISCIIAENRPKDDDEPR